MILVVTCRLYHLLIFTICLVVVNSNLFTYRLKFDLQLFQKSNIAAQKHATPNVAVLSHSDLAKFYISPRRMQKMAQITIFGPNSRNMHRRPQIAL